MFKVYKDCLIKINELKLHDSELNEVICKYEENKVIIPIKHYYFKSNMILIFEDVLYSEISYKKLWGNGNYIFDCEAYDTDELLNQFKEIHKMELSKEHPTWSKLIDYENLEEFFCIILILNSGDKIKLITRKLSLENIGK